MPARKHQRPKAGEPARPAPADTRGHEPAKRVFVLGAGVDVVYGLPTMTTLLRELAAFAEGEGLPIHRALRAKLPRVRFKFSDFAGSKSEAVLARMFSGEGAELIGQLRSAAAKLGAEEDTAGLQALIERLCDLAERNQLTEGEATELVRLTHSSYEVGGGEPVLEPRLTRVASQGYRYVFQQALRNDAALTEAEREALQFFIEAVSNIEDLLSEYFMRFSLGRRSDQRTFLYIIWMFWAFMRLGTGRAPRRDNSIYARLAGELAGDIVTFNYTDFFDGRTARRVRHFHGRLDEYLRLDTREVVRDGHLLQGATTVDGIVALVNELRLDVEQLPAVDVPALVPPTAFKPVTHRRQLRTWADVDRLLTEASEVVVVGYSFALADEHFNDLLRHANPRSRVFVINPDLATASREACRVLGIDHTSLASADVSGLPVKRGGRLTCVAAAGEVLTDALLTQLRR